MFRFHQQHCSHTLPPTGFFVQLNEVEPDDGLGYYHDGVKRTLTDEQIAIFRHSEIQTLLKARRSQRSSFSPTVNEVRPSGDRSIGEDPEFASSHLDDDGEANVKINSRRNTSSAEGSPLAAIRDHDHTQSEFARRKKRRKAKKHRRSGKGGDKPTEDDKIKPDRVEEEFTYRRIARELDDVKEASIHMDY